MSNCSTLLIVDGETVTECTHAAPCLEFRVTVAGTTGNAVAGVCEKQICWTAILALIGQSYCKLS